MKKFIFTIIIFCSIIGISEAQVFNPISYNNKPDLNYYQHTASSIYSGTTSTGAAWTVNPLAEVTLATFTIPGGSMGANGSLLITQRYSHTSASNARSMTQYFGGSQIGVRSSGAAETVTMTSILVQNRNSVSSQLSDRVNATGLSYATTSVFTTAAINTSNTVTLALKATTSLESGLTPTSASTGNGTTCTVTILPSHGYNTDEYVQAASGSNCSTSGSPNADPVKVTSTGTTTFTYPCTCTGNMVSTFPTFKRYSVIQLESVDINVKYNP